MQTRLHVQMITTKAKYSSKYGSTITYQQKLIDNASVDLNTQKFNLVSPTLAPLVKFSIQNNQLFYSLGSSTQQYVLTPDSAFLQQNRVGVSNGVCPLNSQTKVDQAFLPFNVYTGPASNINTRPASQNDLYVTNDTLQLYIYTNDTWNLVGATNPPPITNFDLNNQKITNLAPGQLSSDAVNFGQLERNHFTHAYLDSDITDLGPNIGATYVSYKVNFPQFIDPSTLTPPIQPCITHAQDNGFSTFTLLQGVYTINIKTLVQYKGSTQFPVKFYIYDLDTGPISYTLIEADRTDNFQQKKITNNSLVLKVTSTRTICLQFDLVSQYVNNISAGTSMYIQKIN